MDNETPKPMKKVHRNLFHKVGKKLEKFEQNLGISNSNLSHGFGSSSDISTTSHHHRNSENSQEDDTISLQYSHSDSPKAVLRHKHADRLSYPHSSLTSNDVQESDESIVKDSNTQYHQEMQIICKELMENKTDKLQDCRDYDKKVSLLRIALSFNTPKVTGPVILFLENTLSKPLFYELIKQHPTAIKNYINLAKLRLENDHYIAMLKQFGKNEDVAMIRIRQASETYNINNKIALIDQAAVELASHPWWHLQIAEYQYLLQKQRELQRSLLLSQPNIRLENQTALETYKILYDIDFRQQKYTGNTDNTIVERRREIATALNMSQEIVMCGKLSVIMKCGLRMHYEDFLQQTTTQSVFGKKYIIAPENLADMVYNWVRLSGEGQEKASEKAEKFLNMIHDPGRRIYYAEKFQNYNVAMDTLANVLRDRVQLENLRKRMPQDHPSFHRATSLLENTKWRN